MLNLKKVDGFDGCFQINDPIVIPGTEFESRLFVHERMRQVPPEFDQTTHNTHCWSLFHQYREAGSDWSDENVAGIWESEIEYEWYGTSEDEIKAFFGV